MPGDADQLHHDIATACRMYLGAEVPVEPDRARALVEAMAEGLARALAQIEDRAARDAQTLAVVAALPGEIKQCRQWIDAIRVVGRVEGKNFGSPSGARSAASREGTS